jgi:hypothetical protein
MLIYINGHNTVGTEKVLNKDNGRFLTIVSIDCGELRPFLFLKSKDDDTYIVNVDNIYWVEEYGHFCYNGAEPFL